MPAWCILSIPAIFHKAIISIMTALRHNGLFQSIAILFSSSTEGRSASNVSVVQTIYLRASYWFDPNKVSSALLATLAALLRLIRPACISTYRDVR